MTEGQAEEAAGDVQEKTGEGLIGIDQFMNVDLRVGKILTCEKLPKSRKLLLMKVDLGSETRQILAGLSTFYLPEEMVGRRVIVVANLKPAKLMGHESQGMLLAAGEAPAALVTVPEGIPLGARVR